LIESALQKRLVLGFVYSYFSVAREMPYYSACDLLARFHTALSLGVRLGTPSSSLLCYASNLLVGIFQTTAT